MPDIIRFSDMKNDHPLQLNGANDLLAIAVVSGGTETGYNSMTTTPNQLGQHIVIDQEFANLTTTAKTIQGAINELKADGGSSSHEYSTTEQVVGTWIDGRDVYEKTVYNAGGLSGDFFIPHGITNLDRVISCQGSYYDTNAGTSGAIGVVPRIENNLIGVTTFTSTDIQIRVPNIFGTRIVDWYFVVRYVKTTT